MAPSTISTSFPGTGAFTYIGYGALVQFTLNLTYTSLPPDDTTLVTFSGPTTLVSAPTVLSLLISNETNFGPSWQTFYTYTLHVTASGPASFLAIGALFGSVSLTVDIPGCEYDANLCGSRAACTQTSVGEYACSCAPGFTDTRVGVGGVVLSTTQGALLPLECVDADECLTGVLICTNGTCVNLVGSATCDCPVSNPVMLTRFLVGGGSTYDCLTVPGTASYCPSQLFDSTTYSTGDNSSNVGITWPAMLPGSVATLACPLPLTGTMTRICCGAATLGLVDGSLTPCTPDGFARWGIPAFSLCESAAIAEAYHDLDPATPGSLERVNAAAAVSRNVVGVTDFVQLRSALALSVGPLLLLAGLNRTLQSALLTDVLGVVSTAFAAQALSVKLANALFLVDFPTFIVQLSQVMSSALDVNTSIAFDTAAMAFAAINTNPDTFTGLMYSTSSAAPTPSPLRRGAAPQHLHGTSLIKDSITVVLPSTLFADVTRTGNGALLPGSLSLLTYASARLFTPANSTSVLSAVSVITVDGVDPAHVAVLSAPVCTSYHLNVATATTSTVACAYWAPLDKAWVLNDTACVITYFTAVPTPQVTCCCTTLGAFAVVQQLLVGSPAGGKKPVPDGSSSSTTLPASQTLPTIVNVGGACSLLFLAVALYMLIMHPPLASGQSAGLLSNGLQKLARHYVFSVFLLVLVFLVAGSVPGGTNACRVVSILLFYLALVALTWPLLMSLNLYLRRKPVAPLHRGMMRHYSAALAPTFDDPAHSLPVPADLLDMSLESSWRDLLCYTVSGWGGPFLVTVAAMAAWDDFSPSLGSFCFCTHSALVAFLVPAGIMVFTTMCFLVLYLRTNLLALRGEPASKLLQRQCTHVALNYASLLSVYVLGALVLLGGSGALAGWLLAVALILLSGLLACVFLANHEVQLTLTPLL